MMLQNNERTAMLMFQTNPVRQRGNARNVSFRISLRWLIHIINSADKTKSILRELHSTILHVHTCFCFNKFAWPLAK